MSVTSSDVAQFAAMVSLPVKASILGFLCVYSPFETGACQKKHKAERCEKRNRELRSQPGRYDLGMGAAGKPDQPAGRRAVLAQQGKMGKIGNVITSRPPLWACASAVLVHREGAEDAMTLPQKSGKIRSFSNPRSVVGAPSVTGFAYFQTTA